MATWKKQGDAYFADTFDRDSAYAYNCATTDAVIAKGTTLSIGNNATLTCADTGWNEAALAKISGEVYNNYAVKSDVDLIQSQLKKIQEQIDKLKERPMVTSDLRSALKTLHYKREVE